MGLGCSEQSVEVSADLSKVPGDPQIAELMGMCLAGKAATDEQLQFRTLWQVASGKFCWIMPTTLP